MSILALLLFQQVSEEDLGLYNPSASEWWAWAGAACFLVGIVGFSTMGLRATEKGRGQFADKILVVLVAMTSYIVHLVSPPGLITSGCVNLQGSGRRRAVQNLRADSNR
jgi:hypothetical protein